MKKILTVIAIFLLITACGGGGYGGSGGSGSGTTSYGSGTAPTGNFSGQVDPVQTTDN